MTEIIICSAIWYPELLNNLGGNDRHVFLPKNIEKGIVICGRRHHDCINTVYILTRLRSVTVAEDATGESTQGFLTNTNRFVDRREGMDIAIACGQVDEAKAGKELYSEDLY